MANDQQITASYQRKGMLITYTWRLEINRLTGAIRITSGDEVGFSGTCAPVSNTPKF